MCTARLRDWERTRQPQPLGLGRNFLEESSKHESSDKAKHDEPKHDANQLEHHARKLRTTSPNLEAEAEEIDDRVASIRKQIEMLENGSRPTREDR